MGFKLGTDRGNYAVSGEIKTKMRFHQEAGGDASVPGTEASGSPPSLSKRTLVLISPLTAYGCLAVPSLNPIIFLYLLSYHL